MIPKEIYAETLAGLFAPIRHHLADASVSEILINGPGQVFIERRGQLERSDVRFASPGAVLSALRNVAQYAGTYVDESRPILEARLPDGSRLEAVLAPIVEGGPAVAIRRFSKATMTLDRLVALESLGQDAAEALAAMVIAKCNIVVAGGTGSGKTSLLNVLAACAPASERVLVLEDTRELEVVREHVVYMEARKPDERGAGAVSIRDLFRASLRMRPDRIIVGEIRGAEALDMLQAMVSGHGGCLGTLHASHPRDTLTRLETMCMMSDVNLPLTAIRMQIGSGIDVIVQVSRMADGGRKLTHITEVVAFDADNRRYELRDLFARRTLDDTLNPAEHPRSALLPTGALPSFTDRLREHGQRLPASMLRAADSASAGA
ncbi:MAG: ATPase, T2SS/T4P/T4SS family [Polyangiales bacterium]